MPSVFEAMAMPAQFTATVTGPNALAARSSAAVTSAVLQETGKEQVRLGHMGGKRVQVEAGLPPRNVCRGKARVGTETGGNLCAIAGGQVHDNNTGSVANMKDGE